MKELIKKNINEKKDSNSSYSDDNIYVVMLTLTIPKVKSLSSELNTMDLKSIGCKKNEILTPE